MEEITKAELISAFAVLAAAIGVLYAQLMRGQTEMYRRLADSEARCREELMSLRDKVIDSQASLINILDRRIPHQDELNRTLRDPEIRQRQDDTRQT